MWVLLALLVLSAVMATIDRQVMALVVEPLKKDFGLSDFELGLVQGLSFGLFYCVAGIPLGRLIDKYNRVRILFLGILSWSIMTMLCGFSSTILQFFFFRVGAAVGEAVLHPAAYSLIADTFPPKRMVRAVMIFLTSVLFANGLAFIAGGAVVKAITSLPELPFGLRPWQATFFLVGAPGLVLAAFFLMVREPDRLSGDREGLATFGDSIRYIWGRRRDYGPLYGCSLLLAVPTMTTYLWMPTHFIRTYGLDASTSGYYIGVIYLVLPALGGFAGSVITEKWQNAGRHDASMRIVLLCALIGTVGGLAGIMSRLEHTLVLMLPLALIPVAYYANIVALLQLLTPSRMRGVNSALLLLATNLGAAALASPLVGAMSDTLFAGKPWGLGAGVALVNVSCGMLAAAIAVSSLERFGRVMRDSVERPSGPSHVL
ncbi:hypothetical protein A8G00_23605 [Sphingobium sp. SA916]|nr:hypothetical protein A8G00_23605 [Sphingobium sp. SA916]